MSKKLHVAVSPLTNTIYCGGVSKDGRTWLSNKTDVTHEAVIAVAHHGLAFQGQTGKVLTLYREGVPVIELEVRRL